MTIEEFKKLKVGDKVRIKTLREIKKEFTGNPSDGYNTADSFLPQMYEYAGEVVTIMRIFDNSIIIKEDHESWYYSHDVIKEKVWDETISQPTIVMHLIRDNKTIVKLSNGKVGVAKCSPKDEFDVYEGLRIAAERAYGKLPPIKRRSKVKEVTRVASLDEYIKLVNPTRGSIKAGYRKGDILQIALPGEGNLQWTRAKKGTGFYGFYYLEYVVLENYKPKK